MGPSNVGKHYGAITIEKAINTLQGGYNPQAYSQKQAGNIAAPETDRRVTLADLRPERNPRYHWGDLGNGNLFADWYRAVARYCPERKTWYVYDGTRWVSDTGNVRTMQLCKQLADALVIYALSLPEGSERDSYRAHVEKWQNRRYRETILKDAGSVFPVPISEFDRDKYLYNCLNGTLDLRTFDFRPHNSKDMLTLISGVSYNPDITSPLWEKSVNDAMEGERDKIVFLQKIFGRCLTGDTSEERMYILYGRTSRNGKGTILESFMAMSGGYGRAVSPDSITQKQMFNGSGPTEEIARLAGARVANISEPDKNMVLSAALVKSLTGNDTIRARYLYENSFEFRPQFKMIINCNYLPKITDSTVFTFGRICVVPFNRHFRPEERDTRLKEKLSQPENLSGILNWCLHGLRLIGETGFDPPPLVTEATNEYWTESDKAKRFFDEFLVKDPQGEIRSEEVYQRYSAWCSLNGQLPESSENFKKNMEPFMVCRRKRPAGAGKGANPMRMFCGVRWKG